MSTQLELDEVAFDAERGTVPVVTQDAVSGRVLMLAYADREALERSMATGEMHYRSRTRGLWHKGAGSGNVQKVVSLNLDCDNDTVLARVIPQGPACHTGELACFDERAGDASIFVALARIIHERGTESPGGTESYTRRLLSDRNLRLKKIGEETAELLTALADGDAERSADEAADLLYHVAVALEANGSSLDSVAKVLASRSK